MAKANGETPMKILISVISLALAVAFTRQHLPPEISH
jgi:hypothetical protein